MPSDSSKVRCPWAQGDEYIAYHDREWGVPVHDDRQLFEMLILEGAQAGLSWITILKKRENYRVAFDDFDVERIARYDRRKFDRLMRDPGIVRNRLKIEAAVDNARAYLKLSERQSLSAFIWGFVDGRPIIHERRHAKEVPAETDVSKRISKALKAEGFRFVGPTTVYAFMQSTGMVNDHLAACHRHEACARLQRSFKAPSV